MKTNQSFIKAYRQDAAQPAPARPASATLPRQTVAAFGTTVEYVSAGVAHTNKSTTAQIPLANREGPGEGSTIWPTCHAPFGRIDPPKSIAAVGKRPLSAFTSQSPHRVVSPARSPIATTAQFEPATTVASFAWPNICRALCQQCGPELDRVADRLVREAEAGRALIGVIGLHPQLGTTTNVLCLAARLAARRCRTIVVEGNFLAPRLAGCLDAMPTAWWQDVLERNVPTADAVIRAQDDNLDLLALDTKTSNPLRLAGRLQAFNTASALRGAYDLVLADLGPFFDPDSQPVLLELVRNMRFDAAIVVTGPQGADPRDLATLAEHLDQHGCQLLGTIENRTAKTTATDSPYPIPDICYLTSNI
jgi:Mrp family chromosome partitioning ATPase